MYQYVVGDCMVYMYTCITIDKNTQVVLPSRNCLDNLILAL